MSRSLGKMRHRVELRRPARVSDGALGQVRSDQVVAALWARVEKAGGREVFRYQHLEQEITHKVTIRYREGVEQGQYLRFDGRDLYILVVTDPTELKEFLELVCREGGQL